ACGVRVGYPARARALRRASRARRVQSRGCDGWRATPMIRPCGGSLGDRVGPEDLEELAALADRAQRARDDLGIPVALEVDEVHVLPGPPLGRSRFDFGQVETALGEGLQNAEQH